MTSPSGQRPQQWHRPPPAHAAAAPPGPPSVIEVGKADARRFVIASAILIPLGLIAIIGGVVEAANGRPGGLIALAFGLAFLLIGLVPVFNRQRAFRPRRLVIEQAGIRWDDPEGKPWAVRWQELAAVAIARREPANLDPESPGEKLADAMLSRSLGGRVLVFLDLFPADRGFHQRHPEMAHLWKADRLRVPLGHNTPLLPQLDAAIRYFQSSRFLGVKRI